MWKRIILLILMLIISTAAYAGWFDFVGDVAKAGASTTINLSWAETVKFLAPSIVLIVITIVPVVCLGFAATLAWKYIDLIQSATKDNISIREMISIGLATILIIPIILGLVYFAYHTSNHAILGLRSLSR